MQGVRDLIIKNKKRWPDFEHYLPIIDKAESDLDIHPDISIEKSKALIEGICDSALKYLDNQYSKEWIKTASLGQKFNKAKAKIAEYEVDLEDTFLESANQLIHQVGVVTVEIGRLRTIRGDISHGKAVPKEFASNPHFARMIYNISEGVCYYFLHVLFSVDLNYKKELDYEEYKEFNQVLDIDYAEANQDRGLDIPFNDFLYSKALFDQKPSEYEMQLRDFLDGQTL